MIRPPRNALNSCNLMGVTFDGREESVCIMRGGRGWLQILGDVFRLLALCLRPKTSLAAENLFLRKQLAFYQERKVKPRRADNPTRLTLVLLSRWFNWRGALTVVKPKTFVTWLRKGFRLFWRWKSEAGRLVVTSGSKVSTLPFRNE